MINQLMRTMAMKEEENCIDIEQLKPSDRNDSLRYDHLNLKMIDSVENDDLDESVDIENSKANSKKSNWKRVKQNMNLILTNKDIPTSIDPENLSLRELEDIIEKQRIAKELMKSSWSFWLGRLADIVCVGSTFIIICIQILVLIFYIFKDHRRE